MKILNLYAGIGGNRRLWGDDHEITAVELDPDIAKIYSDFFPNDKMVVGDAHQYLLEHFKGFDFIWSSPPWKWSVENVDPYYDPIEKPYFKLDRHCFWTNFFISNVKFSKREKCHKKINGGTSIIFGFDLSKCKVPNKRQILRNLVNPELGLHILNESQKNEQISMF